jgi:hypothetical protein
MSGACSTYGKNAYKIVVGKSESLNEPSGSIKLGEFLD